MNRLSLSKSPYLRHSAKQPVHWFEHTQGAFAEAKRLKKPILIDSGAMWCHWCHVMDRENYNDSRVASIINKNFIAIKIDRDASPDLDNYYQNVVGQLTGVGGWPLTVFLTERGDPFFGGTYYPPEDQPGMLGFKSILKQIIKTYKQKRKEILRDAKTTSKKIQRLLIPEQSSKLPAIDIHQDIIQKIQDRYDRRYGGFSRAPKFPPYTILNYLCTILPSQKNKQPIIEMIVTTLKSMAQGGISDHLGGAFHRYSTDSLWRVPHFEKMLYDNALLLENYILGYQLVSSHEIDLSLAVLFRQTIEGIINYYLIEGSDSSGGFYASQDADQNINDDGSYYTWDYEEIEKILSKEQFRAIVRYFDITDIGDMPESHGRNILKINKTVHDIARELEIDEKMAQRLILESIEILRASRQKRKKPYIDTNLYTGWNGLMVKAILKAALLLSKPADNLANHRTIDDKRRERRSPDLALFALKTMDRFIEEGMNRKMKCFKHTISFETDLILFEDNVYFLDALIEAYQYTFDEKYLKLAINLAHSIHEHFWNEKVGLYQQTPVHTKLPQQFSILDQPLPAANPVYAEILMKLEHILSAKIKTEKNFRGSAGSIGKTDRHARERVLSEQILKILTKIANTASKTLVFSLSYWKSIFLFQTSLLTIFVPQENHVTIKQKLEQFFYPNRIFLPQKKGESRISICTKDRCLFTSEINQSSPLSFHIPNRPQAHNLF